MTQLSSRMGATLGLAGLLAAAARAAAVPEVKFTGAADLIINGGGGIGYVIIACSVLGISLGLEAALTVTKRRLCPGPLLDELRTLLTARDYQAAYELCVKRPCYLANAMRAALPKIPLGFHEVEEAAGAASEEEAIRLHAKVSYLSLVGTICPLLGLYGTVWGMMLAFETIETVVAPRPGELAGGIKIALVTTFQGLSVAIPITAAYFFFRNRVVSLALELGVVIEELLDLVRPATEKAA